MSQKKYWQEMYDLKTHSNYVEKYLHETEYIDRLINISLAIASSSSIGAWVVWKQYSLMWGFIIAASQVISAIKPVLPFRYRLKALGGLSHDLEELSIQAETKWFQVAGGSMTAEEINKLQFDIRLKKHTMYKKHLGNHSLPDKQGYMRFAEEAASQHFKNYYKEIADV